MNQTFGNNNESGNLTETADGSQGAWVTPTLERLSWVTPALERLSLKQALGASTASTTDVGMTNGS